MQTPTTLRSVALAVIVALAGCQNPAPSQPPAPGHPTPGPTGQASSRPTTAPSTAAPSPTTAAPTTFPLAVVTGVRTRKGVIGLDELEALASAGELVIPCGIVVDAPALTSGAECIPPQDVAAAIEDDQQLVALLPPGLVQPATKVLPIEGDGPFGLFGPDLFGDPEARGLPYPITGRATGEVELDPTWTAYDPSQVWTMTSIGSLCSDRYAAREAVTRGKGWDWVFGGGTAEYIRPPRLNPNPPPGIDQNLWVEPRATGNDGAIGLLQRRADVAIADHECPILPTDEYVPNPFRGVVLSVPEAVIPEWKDILGIDVVYLAANHMSDKGVRGIRSTLRLLDTHGVGRTGLGMNLDEAIEPAYVEVAGVKVAFIAVNDVGGVARADEDTAGVPWITRANIREGVRRAREAGADVIMCDPQWWGGREYHDNLLPKQVGQMEMFFEEGCDHVVGAGTHVAGPMFLRPNGADVSVVLASPGNYVYGQDFFQDLQEGVILEQKFVGVRLANVRLHPYVIIGGARPPLIDPLGDGRYVLNRIFKSCEPSSSGALCSDLDYLP
ncbi:MAG TPA: CapA family protein [Candidatus Binatia bacterium]|nr:CapA family protein [Candidatus Binatia bacterium]